MLRRISLIILSLVLLLLGVALLLPIIYKDEIVGLVQKEANKNLNARIDFSRDIDLSLLRNFPNLSLGLEDFSIVNKAPFEGDTLVSVNRFEAVVDVMSVIRSEQIKLLRIALERPRLNVQVNQEGQANYDIAKATDPTADSETPADTASSNLSVDLQEYSITNAYIRYSDATLPLKTVVRQFNHQGQGDFTLDQFVLSTQSSAQSIDLYFDQVQYLNQVVMDLKADLNIDLANMRFTFRENELKVNELLMKFDGFVSMPRDPIEMSIQFSTRNNQFQDVFSLVPSVYKSDMQNLDASGTMSLSGNINGVYASQPESLPGFNVEFKASDGRFHDPQLPTTLSEVFVDLQVTNPDGVVDNTVVKLSRFHALVNQDTVDAHFLLTDPESDPYVEAGLKGKLNLAALTELLPEQDLGELQGRLLSDLSVKGRMSTLENEQYGQFDAKGFFQLTDFNYADKALPHPVGIPSLDLSITPDEFALKELRMKLGESDLTASGVLRNFLPYYFDDQLLEGELEVRSQYFTLNPYMEEEEETPTETQKQEPTETDTLSAPSIPQNLRFVMDAQMGELRYDELRMRNIAGRMKVENGALIIENAAMDLLDGRMVANGQYNTADSARPYLDFGFSVVKINPQVAYQSLGLVQEYLPIAKNIGGEEAKTRLSTEMSFNSLLGSDLTPVLETVNSVGDFSADDLVIGNNKALNSISSKLKRDDLKRVQLGDVTGAFEIRNGRFFLKPMDFQYQNTRGVIQGSNSLDQTLDYQLNLNTPAGPLQEAAQSLMDNLLGDQMAQVPDRIAIVMGIGGTTNDPKITSVKMGSETSSATDAAKQQLKEELQRRKREAEQKLREEAEKRKQQLEEKRREAERKAKEELEKKKKEAERKKKEAEKKAKQKAKEKKKEAEEKAKEKLDDLF